MDTKEAFRKMLPYYMDRARMNQVELAKAVGKSKASVSLWLSGQSFPRIDTIQKIAQVLGCSTENLVAPAQKMVDHVLTMSNFIEEEKKAEVEIEFLEKWNMASPRTKKIMLAILNALLQDQ